MVIARNSRSKGSPRGAAILTAIMLSAGLFSIVSAAQGNEDLAIMGATQDGLTISFTPQGWIVDTISIDDEAYTVLTFDKSQPNGQRGEPQLPVRVVVVGIPLEGHVSWSLGEISYDEVSTATLLPVPTLVRDEMGIVQERAQKDSLTYHSDEPFPASPVEVTKPVMFRNQRIVKIILKPAQYLPRSNRIRLHSLIRVRLEFHGGGGPRAAVHRPGTDEHLYQRLLLNYEQARPWRKVRHRLSKRSLISMSDGIWYKMSVSQEGMYKVDGNRLSGAGADLSSIDPTTLRVYNNGGRELPRDINATRPDSLIENPIIVVDGGDRRFDPSDYLLFYGVGVEGWEYDTTSSRWAHYMNHYASENIYWLTWGQDIAGKRIETTPSASVVGATAVTTFIDHIFSEEDLHNPFHSGLHWFGRLFIDGDSRTYTIELPGAVPDAQAHLVFRFVGASAGRHTFSTSINGSALDATTITGAGDKYIQFGEFESSVSGRISSGTNTIGVRYEGSAVTSQAYLDWIEAHYTRSLTASGDRLLIYAPPESELYRYQASGFGRNDITVLDVTDLSDIKRIEPAAISSGVVTFADSSYFPQGKRYFLMTPAAYQVPTWIERDVPSDLRSSDHLAELIIITHDEFYNQALQLESLRETWNPSRSIETEVINISDVYDEFSWGLVDVTAIRDFVRYAFEHWGGSPKYILLFGDGDYDYRNILREDDNNWVPPYESTDTHEDATRTSDDWYCYVSGDDNQMDLAIGRFTVRSTSEAQQVVDKIVGYETQYLFGDWRNTITMVADDELVLGGVGSEFKHTSQTESIAEGSIPESFDIKKIYLVEYPAVRSPAISGVIKPLANQALLDQINRGALIIDFIGHGAPQLWTHERVLNSPADFDRIQNGDKYGFWIAASCDFGRFDDPFEQSMSEDLLAVKGRGAVGVLASARLAWADRNVDLNRRFMDYLFEDYSAHGTLRSAGEALWLAKLTASDPHNNERYVLLGDPTLRLVAPRYKAAIESAEPDSIQALALMTVKGYVTKDGNPWGDFDGQVLIKVFDSRKPKTYAPAGTGGVSYILPGNVIYRGTVAVQRGRFEVRFFVPKDISYGGKDGRISVYFWNDKSDGVGFRDGIHVGGTAETVVDQDGPEIVVGFKDRDFASGEYVETDPILRVEISDSVSGVNIAGDIGHKITMFLDGDTENSKDLTEFFNYDQGSHTKGSLEYRLLGLSEGLHHIEIKAWDNSNNSSVSTADFTVVSETELVLRNVLNYPNPMKSQTDFTFEVSRDAEVTIKIYTIAGRLVKIIRAQAAANFNAIRWDGLDEDGDKPANGLYLYQVKAKAVGPEGDVSADALGKLLIAK